MAKVAAAMAAATQPTLGGKRDGGQVEELDPQAQAQTSPTEQLGPRAFKQARVE